MLLYRWAIYFRSNRWTAKKLHDTVEYNRIKESRQQTTDDNDLHRLTIKGFARKLLLLSIHATFNRSYMHNWLLRKLKSNRTNNSKKQLDCLPNKCAANRMHHHRNITSVLPHRTKLAPIAIVTTMKISMNTMEMIMIRITSLFSKVIVDRTGNVPNE